MVSRNLKLKILLMLDMFVIRSSIYVNGKDMAILKTLGLGQVIWVMHKSQQRSLKILSCLGSQETDGGVVLGSDLDFIDFYVFRYILQILYIYVYVFISLYLYYICYYILFMMFTIMVEHVLIMSAPLIAWLCISMMLRTLHIMIFCKDVHYYP